MRTAILSAAVPCLLAACLLSGCKIETGTTTITNVSIDGKANNVTRSFVNDGEGDFECIKSVTGRCHYLLFVRDCSASPNTSDGPRCATRTVRAFTLAAGSARHLANLPPKLRQCVSHDRAPVAPDCAASPG